MNPVAWMVEKDDDVSFIMNGIGLTKPDGSWDKVTPVYTHPAELTDMEIIEISNKFKDLEWAVVAFARAILREAQEK